jgi:transcriptional regulator with XRE-family HTH domain
MPDPRIRRSRLPELMRAKGLSQSNTAHLADVSESLISRVISLEKNFSIVKAKRVAVVLGVTIDDLWEWDY